MSRLSRFRRLVAGAAAVALLAACGGSSGDGANDGNADVPEGTTELELWTFQQVHGTFYETMAGLWNEANPDKQISLNVTVYPYEDMHNKLQLAANANQGMPDVVDIEVNKFANFVQGANSPLLDLTEYAEPYKDDVVQARLDLYSRDGTIYGYPTHVGAFVTFYNEELLDAAGIDYTTIETWDDFGEAGAAYKEATGREFGVASTSVLFVEALQVAQLGGQFFDDGGLGAVHMNEPIAVEAIQTSVDLLDMGAIGTIPGGTVDEEEGYGAVNNGDFAAIVYPAWYTSRFVDYMDDLKGKIAIAPAPVFEDGVYKTIGGGGTGTAVAASSPHAELAAEWLAFAKLSEEASIAVWEDLGFDPVNMAVWEMEEITHDPDNKYNQYFTTNLFDVLNSVKDSIGHFESFGNENLPAVDTQFRTVTGNDLYENGMSAQEALDKSQADLENQLGQ